MAIEIDQVTTIDSSADLNIYKNEKSFRVFAGPGAGKTYLLIENIKLLVEKSHKIKKGGREILCITYTNAAADEVKKRLGNYNQYVYVSTIHSFIYDMVLKYNHKQLKFQIKDKYGIEVSKQVILKPRIEGLNLLAMCKKADLHEFLVAKGIPEERVSSFSKTKIGRCIWDIKNINSYPFNEHCEVNLSAGSTFTDDELKLIKSAIIEVGQELDFDEILYWGYMLIKEYKHIRYYLRYRFPYVFVDEYQDTNPIQNATLKLFADSPDVVWGVIGDLIQSIYAFQGATYQEFENFQTLEQQIDYKIDDNRRSTDSIIKFCSYFRQKDTIIPKQECAKNIETNKVVKIVLHTGVEEPNTLFEIDDDTAILCRGAAEVFSFTKIDTVQKKALKSIADTYQYKYGYDMENAIDQGREDWLKLSKLIVGIKIATENKSLAAIMSACQGVLDIEKITKKSNEQGVYYKKLITLIERVNTITDTTIIQDIEENINDWLEETGMMMIDKFFIPSEGDDYYEKNIHKNARQLTYDTIRKMIEDVYSTDSKIMTIHKSKGLEFKKVIVGIEPFSRREKFIDKFDVLINPTIIRKDANVGSDDSKIAEYTRLIYVGLSRAINELSLYIRIKPEEKDRFKSDFDNSLKEYMRINDIAEAFYVFIDS